MRPTSGNAKFKRTYKSVVVDSRGDAHTVLLDDNPATTPRKHTLAFPTRALAEAIANEWRLQERMVDPALMTLTRFANTALDRPGKIDIVSVLLSYANADLMVHRADEEPLAQRQRDEWDPVLAWARDSYNAHLVLSRGIVPVEQQRETVAALRAAVEPHDRYVLTGLHAMTEITASLILSLAIAENRLSAAEGFALSQLDERYQAERWGIDSAAKKRAIGMAEELENAALFVALARP